MNKEELIINNKIPKCLEYLGIKYNYMCNKGDLLCYTYTPHLCDNIDGSTIIVEFRKNKQVIDQFYVLFHIVGMNVYDTGYTSVSNLKGYTRQAKPIF